MQDLKQYQYLEPRSHRWKKQLWVKGRNMTVWNLVAWMQTNSFTPEQAANDFELPVEAIYEAISYYRTHKSLVDAETNEERKRLQGAGILKRDI